MAAHGRPVEVAEAWIAAASRPGRSVVSWERRTGMLSAADRNLPLLPALLQAELPLAAFVCAAAKCSPAPHKGEGGAGSLRARSWR
jgi:hypothetical protein